MALGTHRHDELVRHRRHGARHAVIAFQRRAGSQKRQISLPSASDKQRNTSCLLVAVVIHQIHAPVQHRRAGVTFARVNGPELARPGGGPGSGEWRGIGADAIVVGAAKSGPRAR